MCCAGYIVLAWFERTCQKKSKQQQLDVLTLSTWYLLDSDTYFTELPMPTHLMEISDASIALFDTLFPATNTIGRSILTYVLGPSRYNFGNAILDFAHFFHVVSL